MLPRRAVAPGVRRGGPVDHVVGTHCLHVYEVHRRQISCAKENGGDVEKADDTSHESFLLISLITM